MENFIIKTDGSKHVIAPKNGNKFELEELQELVGGYIQVIRLNNKDNQCMIVNENGKLYNMAHNDEASIIAHSSKAIFDCDYIVGDAVIINYEQLD